MKRAQYVHMIYFSVSHRKNSLERQLTLMIFQTELMMSVLGRHILLEKLIGLKFPGSTAADFFPHREKGTHSLYLLCCFFSNVQRKVDSSQKMATKQQQVYDCYFTIYDPLNR
jgi:hypothetical protein